MPGSGSGRGAPVSCIGHLHPLPIFGLTAETPVPSPYRAIFAAPAPRASPPPGSWAGCRCRCWASAIVTMVSQLTGRYGLAGALSATLALSAAAIGPQISRLVDRHGQRRVLRPAALVSVVAGRRSAAVREVRARRTGRCSSSRRLSGCVPSVGSMVRARWAALYRGSPAAAHRVLLRVRRRRGRASSSGRSSPSGCRTAWFPEAGPLLAAVFLARRCLLADRAARDRAGAASARTALRGVRAALAGSAGAGGDVRGDRRDLRRGRRGDRRFRRGRGPQGGGQPGAGGVRAGLLRRRERSSGCCTSRGRPHAGGWWVCARWP